MLRFSAGWAEHFALGAILGWVPECGCANPQCDSKNHGIALELLVAWFDVRFKIVW